MVRSGSSSRACFLPLGKKVEGHNILYQREFYLLKLILKHYEMCSSIKYWHRTVSKCPWRKTQCCAQHCTSIESRVRLLTQSTSFRSTTWASSPQMEPRKCTESRRPTGIFLGWHVQLLNSVFLRVGRVRGLGRVAKRFASDWGTLGSPGEHRDASFIN